MTRFTSIDPATGDTVWEGPAATGEQVAAAVTAARTAFPDWADRPRQDRIDAMLRYQAALKARAPAMAEAISRETGKALWETTAELGSMAGKVDLSIKAYDERTGERTAETPFGTATLRHRPHGVAAVLGPFNFPGHLPNGHIVPALLAGDTVVFKPSEETPHTGQLMAECLAEADLPTGVFNLIQGARDTGAALLDQPIDALMFTGSGAAGAHFRRKFAEDPHVILALELGGNNPLVVWDAADAEAVAGIVVQSAFITTGQRCSCARRLIVPEGPQGDAIIEAVAALVDRLIFAPWDSTPEPYGGPLISPKAAEAALSALQARIYAGARVIRASGPVDNLPGAFVKPAIIEVTGVTRVPAPVMKASLASSASAGVKALPVRDPRRQFRRRHPRGQCHPIRPQRRSGQRQPGPLGPFHPPHPRRCCELQPPDDRGRRQHAVRRPGGQRQPPAQRLLRRRLLRLSGRQFRGRGGEEYRG